MLNRPKVYFYRLISYGNVIGSVKRNQAVLIVGRGTVKFDDLVTIGVFPSPFYFSSCSYLEARNIGSKISIGRETTINNGFVAIVDHTSIDIGQRVLIGTNVEIYDSDFHGLNVAERKLSKKEKSKPVKIEDDVFIGSNVRICKGVTIGTGSVIANSSVVIRDVPENSIAGGNPAAIIKKLDERS
jgi:maltose O-acetyltransferase